jgi:hypothetical protein
MSKPDLSHLHALEARLARELSRVANATTHDSRVFRQYQVSQVEREIAGERRFLGLPDEPPLPDMTDDELLAELNA